MRGRRSDMITLRRVEKTGQTLNRSDCSDLRTQSGPLGGSDEEFPLKNISVPNFSVALLSLNQEVASGLWSGGSVGGALLLRWFGVIAVNALAVAAFWRRPTRPWHVTLLPLLSPQHHTACAGADWLTLTQLTCVSRTHHP